MKADTKSVTLFQDMRVQELVSLDGSEFYWLRLNPPNWSWTPGQFVMLRPQDWSADPFLPRPLSIADLNEHALSLFWQVVGKGTRKMTHLRPGDRIRLWGPLGRGFDYDPDIPTLLLAGGMGIVPFIGLIRNHPKPENLELIFGHRQDVANYPLAELSKRVLTWNLQDRTRKDLARLERAVRVKIQGYSGDGRVLACGPDPFLRMVSRLSRESGARTQICMETPMACGHGVCLACSVSGAGGETYQACTDGPVFAADQLALDEQP